MKDAIVAVPENKMPPGSSIYLYTAKARKKLDEIDRAITSNLRAARLVAGDTIDDSGYSGRQQKRR